MTQERWDKVITQIEEKFGITERGEGIPEDGKGRESWVIFVTPGGTMKLMRTERPRLIGEKTQYSHRIGGQVKVDKVYDASDVVSFVKGYRRDDPQGRWVEIEYPLQ